MIGRSAQRGAALLILLVILVLGALSWLLDHFSTASNNQDKSEATVAALVEARAALIGYALRYRDRQMQDGQFDWMYGHLPLPDLGSSRNNNVACNGEGCDAAAFTGITFDARGVPPTIIGRLPWKTLGLAPLKDGDGECLWLVVSSLHGRIRQSPPPASPPAPYPHPINGDTLGQLDIVVANGSPALVSLLNAPHQRPLAIVFAPGSPLPGQNRSPSTVDEVTQCGGNYEVRNYLDPETASALGGVTHWFAGSTHGATGPTGDSDPSNDPDPPKAFSLAGRVLEAGGRLWSSGCAGQCTLLADDRGLALTGDDVFIPLRRSANFIADLNAYLDRIQDCLRDGGVSPEPITGVAPPDKTVGRLPAHACYDASQPPQGYDSHYRERMFVATGSGLAVNSQPCGHGVLLYANARAADQQRASAAQRNTLSNYLEGQNLVSFTGAGNDFIGAERLDRAPPQAPEQDIVRCLSATPAFITVASLQLTALGQPQLVAWDGATRTLTLGHENVTTAEIGTGNAAALFGCAWQAEVRPLGGGLRVYFNFRFKRLGTSVGSNGFVFAVTDGASNDGTACGAAGSHLGYSGSNPWTPKIAAPKIGIEFDQGRDTGFNESANPGRNDPCGTSGCGGTAGYNSHAALVYWGHETANAYDGVSLPDNDDNAHGLPSPDSLGGEKRPPRNPPYPSSGIAFKDLRDKLLIDGERWSWLYHVRLELTPLREADPLVAQNSRTRLGVQVWIEGDASKTAQIAALKNPTRPMAQLFPSLAPTLSDSITIYDRPMGACAAGGSCPEGQRCGSDLMCYRPPLATLRMGFTNAQRTQDQEVRIADYFAVSLP